MFERHIEHDLNVAFGDTPVVLVTGAREAGKTTLARELAKRRGARYLTLDDATTLASAQSDPAGFVAGADPPAVIDEAQRAPELMPAIKQAVDDARAGGGRSAAGLFVLTGSADIWSLPPGSEPLAGCTERVPLWPLSQGELHGRRETFIDDAFAGNPPTVSGAEAGRAAVSQALVRGGYPDAVERVQPKRRREWFERYIGSVLERDLRDLSDAGQTGEVADVLKLLAERVGSPLNVSGLASELGLPRKALARCVELLEAVFLIHRVPAWSAGGARRPARGPKVWLADSGMASHLLCCDAKRIEADDSGVADSLFENFVGMELVKQATWSRTMVGVRHYRAAGGAQVPIVLESRSGDVCGVELKLDAEASRRDFRRLERLKEAIGPRFRAGILIYAGGESLTFGRGLWALPVSALWTPSEGDLLTRSLNTAIDRRTRAGNGKPWLPPDWEPGHG